MTSRTPTTFIKAPASTPNRLRPFWFALLLGMLTLLYGFSVGIVFGVAEDSMKDSMKESADAVMAEVYQGDEAKAKAVLSKAWSYQKRAHLHAGGLGAASLVLILLLALATPQSAPTHAAALMLGVGSLGYSVFWMLAGFAAPGLGSTDAAKESLSWLAMPSAAAVVLGTLLTTILVTIALTRKVPQPV